MTARRGAAGKPDDEMPQPGLHALPTPGQGSASSRARRRDPSPEESDTQNSLGWRATALIAFVVAAGALTLGVFAPEIDPSDLPGILLLTALTAVATRFNVTVYGETRVSVSFVALFAVVVLYGAPGVVVAGPVAAASLHFPRGLISLRFLFDAGNAAVSGSLGALAFHLVADPPSEGVSAAVVPAALAGAGVIYVVNAYVVDQIVAFTTGRSLFEVWAEKDRWLFPHYVVLCFLGVALALAYDALGVVGLLAFAAPPVMMQLSIKQYIDRTTENVSALRRKNRELEGANRDLLEMSRHLRETYDGTLEALVTALDARDRETRGHSSRVCGYTLDIARDMGIGEGSDDWAEIQRGALLHDVGKIGVTDFILRKPGPLTPEEWQEMRRHPEIGYRMLREVSFLSPAAEIVHAHHERYDGKGYPNGLAGEEIPLGARIFAVADTFDAMTSDRPYRRALPPEAARDEIRRNAGTQFDPKVVEAFLRMSSRWIARRASETGRRAA